jgi:GDP-D-mannose dehydratase
VVATGSAYSLEDFTTAAFGELGLNWRDHVELDHELQRPSDIMCSRGDAGKAYAELGWKPNYTMPDVVRMMVQAEFKEGIKEVTTNRTWSIGAVGLALRPFGSFRRRRCRAQ